MLKSWEVFIFVFIIWRYGVLKVGCGVESCKGCVEGGGVVDRLGGEGWASFFGDLLGANRAM